LALKPIWLPIYGNDLGNHMVFRVIIVYGQPYGFQGQPYGSKSTTWFKVKNSSKSPYSTGHPVPADVFLSLPSLLVPVLE